MKYVVISPARNEAEYLPETVRSMVAQTVRPVQWIIANDGSTDATGAIAREAAAQHSWITVIDIFPDSQQQQPNSRGGRAIEAKEIQAFHKGMAHLTATDWEFIVKLDADVGFKADYFVRCLSEFGTDPKLGIAGGTILNKVETRLLRESHPRFHVRGATKIYRRACWEAIGGIPNMAGWDTIDEVTANMKGWHTRTIDGVEMIHFRPTGRANGWWKNSVKNGLWSYIAGYHPLFFLMRCGKQCLRPPYAGAAAGLLYGYLQGYLGGVSRVGEDVVRYVGQQQMNRLLARPTTWR
jgi:glycosyltransferase involved in cell wall biosynthesis